MSDARVNFLDPAVRAAPHLVYARMRRESPVCQIDPAGIWAVTRYEDVMTVLRTPEVFSSEGSAAAFSPPWLDRNPLLGAMNMADPPRHGPLRALISRAFNTATIHRLEPLLRQVAAQLVPPMLERREVDLVHDFCQHIPAAAMMALMGLDPAHGARFLAWAKDFADLASIALDENRQSEIRTDLREMEEYMNGLLEERRRNPGTDVISDLIRAEIDGQKLTHEELMSFCFLLLPAGIETVTHQLALMLHMLMTRPELQEQLRAARSLLPPFIEEMLRYDPVAQGLFRMTTADTTLGGVNIPKHSIVMLVMASATHDEAQFQDPERFDLDRPGPQNTVFGHGIHFCIGASLARMELRVALEELLSRAAIVPGVEPAQWRLSLAVRGPAVLPAEIRAV
ncbi:cytochrome P450 [Polyangium aurulentum]|uniref:cytochrome P450 n=1 Tax=Polyangium aurulentum TaxID=2567896 RepID=UPI00146EDC53|nr:cytochrome P450 [Polyangium aurulentum]UQA57775.1 cytochrome P450 [Polyangium aurulentum]